MKSMYQKIRNLLFHTLVPAVLAVLMLPMTAFAQEVTNPISLPVEVKVTGTSVPSDLEYQLVLEAVGNAPMPEASQLTVKNGETAAFGPIHYTELENYSYRIYQKAGDNSRVTYDSSVYMVTVQVLNDGSGGLKANVLASKDNSADKSGSITFTNAYTASSDGGNNSGGSGGNGGGGGGKDRVTDPQNPVNIEDEAVPLEAPTIIEQIEDLLVPLNVLPKTGDGSISYVTLLLILVASGGMIFWLVQKRRKKEME